MGYSPQERTIPCVINDFQLATSETEQDEIVDAFCGFIWSIEPVERTTIREISYDVPPSVPVELAEILDKHRRIRYIDGVWRCESVDSFTLLKQSINNTFSKYCDRDVLFVSKESGHLIKFLDKLYSDVACGRFAGSAADLDDLFRKFSQDASDVLRRNEAKKVNMTWGDYTMFVRESVKSSFSHYKDPDTLNASHSASQMASGLYNYLTTSNYAVKYIGKTIRMNMAHRQQVSIGKVNWRAHYVPCPKCGFGYVTAGEESCPLCSSPRPRRKSFCSECGILFSQPPSGRRNQYCPSCYKIRRKNAKRILEKQRRSRIRGQN